MNAKTVRFNAENERSYCFAQYLRRQGGATRHSLPMKQLTAAVLRAELTPLQRFCVTEYYMHGKRQKEIAAQLKRNLKKELEMDGDKLDGMVEDMMCKDM